MFQEKNIFQKPEIHKVPSKQEDVFGLENLTEDQLIEKFWSFHVNDEIYVDGKKLPKDENGDFIDLEDFIFSQKYEQESESEKRKRNAITGISDKDDDYLEKLAILKRLSEIGSKKSIDLIVDFIRLDRDVLYMYSFDRILEKDTNYSAEKLLKILNEVYFNEWQAMTLIVKTTDLIGVEEVRSKLNKMIEKEKNNSEFSDNLEYARTIITPNHDKIAIENLQKFYQEKIKFEDYKVNQEMNEKEVTLLKSLIRKDEKVLEVGCGTGRLLLEMKKAGYDIAGFDFTERHIDFVKEQNPDINVFQADWHDTKMPNESQNVVYSLGRNILHDYSIVDQVQTFREANRVLKQGGKFIFDIPNREKGGYKQMVAEYSNEMQKRGIRNFRYGTIYDSPDGVNFATRYTYSHEDIAMLAQMTGFEISLVKKEPLATGKEDENLYYTLEKT